MKKMFVRLTAVCAALAMGLFAAGCSAPANDDAADKAPTEQGQPANGGSGNNSNNGGGNGANGSGSGQGNSGATAGDNWSGTDVAEAPTVGNLGNFTADTIDGGTFSAADLRDKDVTVVNFWSITCPPCVAEMPDLAKIQAALPENVQLITVLLDSQSGVTEAKSILADAGYKGVTLVPSSSAGDLAAACGDIMYMPTTVLYDANGQALSEFIGGQQNLERTIQNAVNHQLSIMGKPEITIG